MTLNHHSFGSDTLSGVRHKRREEDACQIAAAYYFPVVQAVAQSMETMANQVHIKPPSSH